MSNEKYGFLLTGTPLLCSRLEDGPGGAAAGRELGMLGPGRLPTRAVAAAAVREDRWSLSVDSGHAQGVASKATSALREIGIGAERSSARPQESSTL